jgi:AraC family transcriptional regulator, regulatory protein of adaptative response / methylated-DNA-[protein]-cysteine methyltransferase
MADQSGRQNRSSVIMFAIQSSQDDVSRTVEKAPGDGEKLQIHFKIGQSWLGSVLVATTGKGICAILLGDDPGVLPDHLEGHFAQAQFIEGGDDLERLTATVADFIAAPHQGLDVPLDLQGTPFQLRVWQALRAIPAGATASYSDIAGRIGAPTEAYAVGEACAANTIAVAVPCHRVVRKDGALAGYRWGFKRKRALLKREAVS